MNEEKREKIITSALEIFKNKSIDSTKMTEVAQLAEVGVATVYRYFLTKFELAKAAGSWLWEKEISDIYSQYEKENSDGTNGYEKVKNILGLTLYIYEEHPEYIRFIENFDNFLIKENISKEMLKDYDISISALKEPFIAAMKEGQQDGSIKSEVDINEFYFTITHSLISLSQKLLIRGHIIESDEFVTGTAQIKLLIEMATKFIKQESM